jgi:hypothetical protein
LPTYAISSYVISIYKDKAKNKEEIIIFLRTRRIFLGVMKAQ